MKLYHYKKIQEVLFLSDETRDIQDDADFFLEKDQKESYCPSTQCIITPINYIKDIPNSWKDDYYVWHHGKENITAKEFLESERAGGDPEFKEFLRIKKLYLKLKEKFGP